MMKIKRAGSLILVTVLTIMMTACSEKEEDNTVDSSASSDQSELTEAPANPENTDTADDTNPADDAEAEKEPVPEQKPVIEAAVTEDPEDKFWTFDTGKGIGAASVCIDDAAYFGNNGGIFYALDLAAKKELWHYNTGASIRCKPAVSDGAIFFSSGEIYYALDINTGEEIWKTDIKAGEKQKKRIDTWDYHDSSPVIDGNTVYFGSGTGSVIGFDIKTGDVAWEFAADDRSAVRTTPLIQDGIIYFGDWSGRYYAVNLLTKDTVWVNTYPATFQSESALGNGVLLFGGRDTCLHAVEPATGKELWTYRSPVGSWITGDPVIQDGLIYITTSDAKTMFVFNLSDGTVIKKYNVFMNSFSKAVIHKDKIFVTSGNAYAVPGTGKLQVYNTGENTDLIYSYLSKTGAVFSSPMIWKDRVCFGNEAGSFYVMNMSEWIK